jgi:hypothetical protein
MRERSTLGMKAITAFLVFATLMASLAGITLTWHGTVLDRAWALNPQAYARVAPMGRLPGILFLILAAVLATAALAWSRRLFWGWLLVVVIISGQVLGAALNIYQGEPFRALAGFIIGGGLLVYLCRPQVRLQFKAPLRGESDAQS